MNLSLNSRYWFTNEPVSQWYTVGSEYFADVTITLHKEASDHVWIGYRFGYQR